MGVPMEGLPSKGMQAMIQFLLDEFRDVHLTLTFVLVNLLEWVIIRTGIGCHLKLCLSESDPDNYLTFGQVFKRALRIICVKPRIHCTRLRRPIMTIGLSTLSATVTSKETRCSPKSIGLIILEVGT